MDQLWFTAEGLRTIDRHAVEQYGIPSIVLMENAAIALRDAALSLVQRFSLNGALILCGPGNNGGDGFALARHLHIAGIPTRILATRAPEVLRGDARINALVCRRVEIPIALARSAADAQTQRDRFPPRSVLLVDALLGTGAARPLENPIDELVAWLNAQSADPVLAVDLPTGFDADTGPTLGLCVRATHTVTFVGRKLGFAHHKAADFLGDWTVASIGVPSVLLHQNATTAPNPHDQT
jgi:NAD(P)H-hydrate epimerase